MWKPAVFVVDVFLYSLSGHGHVLNIVAEHYVTLPLKCNLAVIKAWVIHQWYFHEAGNSISVLKTLILNHEEHVLHLESLSSLNPNPPDIAVCTKLQNKLDVDLLNIVQLKLALGGVGQAPEEHSSSTS